LRLLLESEASCVLGVDLDPAVVAAAKEETAETSAQVVVGNGVSLPFSDGYFDVVTSFETLEHLQDRSGLLSELRRVLNQSGVCIISTPNANFTEPVNGRPKNPYHVFEYTPRELIQELRCYFSDIQLLGQKLRANFKMTPFVDEQRRLPKTLGIQSRLLLWRVIYKLPPLLQDRLSYWLWGHEFVPGVGDYEFSELHAQHAPVLVAVCRGHVER
jgi:SAM-dependent methyltransferase